MYEVNPLHVSIAACLVFLFGVVVGYTLEYIDRKRRNNKVINTIGMPELTRGEPRTIRYAAPTKLYYNLESATHLGGLVQGFRVYRSGAVQQDVGYTEDESVARTYVRGPALQRSDLFLIGDAPLIVEAVTLFKTPTGDLLKNNPIYPLPVLKPFSEYVSGLSAKGR